VIHAQGLPKGYAGDTVDFELTSEQKTFGEEIGRFAEGLTRPAGAESPADEKTAWPAGMLRQLGGMHLMGVVVPPEEGGGGKDHVSYALALIAVSRKSVSTGALLFVNNSLFVHSILAYGNNEQRKRYLRSCIAGEGMGTAPVGYPFAEPEEVRMNAVRTGDGWNLRGRHFLVGNGFPPSHVLLPAVTGEGTEVSLFVLDLENNPGLHLSAEKGEPVRGERFELIAEDAVLLEDGLLGTRGKGLEYMTGSRPFLWIGISAHAVGIGRSILDRALAYSQGSKRCGKTLFSSQAVQWALADMATELDAAESLVLRAAWLADRRKPCEKEAAMAKLYASDAALKAVTNGGRILGEEGLDDAYWGFLRHAERCQIEQGNNLRMKGYITSRLVGELKGA
jgi:alkylation response protein AidB-like acyl-CoA dehydrogenase